MSDTNSSSQPTVQSASPPSLSRSAVDKSKGSTRLRQAQQGPASPPLSPLHAHSPHASFLPPSSATILTPPSIEPAIMDPSAHPPTSLDREGDTVMSEECHGPQQRTPSLKRKLEDSAPVSDNKRSRTETEEPPEPAKPAIASPPAQDAVPKPAVKQTHLFHWTGEPVPPSLPDVTVDLIKLYGLQDVANSVARKDPVTGAKINKLRKSYAGKIKDLAGTQEPDKWSGNLTMLMNAPEDQFHVARRAGMDIKDGLPPGFDAQLDRALDLQPGKLSKEDELEWTKYLALDAAPKLNASTAPPFTGMLSAPRPSFGASPPAVSSPSSDTNPRSMRRNTKRRYHDGSFEGYVESFGDDDSDTPLAERRDDNDDGGSARKKHVRRKDFQESGTARPGVAGAGGGLGYHAGSNAVGVTSGGGGGYPQR